jgi:hypothetical protein
MLKQRLKKILYPTILYIANYFSYKLYVKQYKRVIKRLGVKDMNPEGLDEYRKKWKKLDNRVEKYSYIFFSRIVGNTPDIVPENIGHNKITPVLNPSCYAEFYSDKNMYDYYMSDVKMPRVIARRVDGGKILDKNFKVLKNGILNEIHDGCRSIVLKPATDTDSGIGVMMFRLSNDGDWHSVKENAILSDDLLLNYKWDFVIQEAVTQNSYLSKFCHSALNTFRINVYRSVVDEEIHVLNAAMRIGRNGEIVDNAHAGGVLIGIDIKTGVLDKCAFDSNYNEYREWNGISFNDNNFCVPNWDKVMSFAKQVASKNVRCRLFALDITLDEEGNPVLIEANVKNFAFWVSMITGRTTFGKFTDEIIEYCASHKVSDVKILIG